MILLIIPGFIIWNYILYLIEPEENYDDEIPRDILPL